MSPYNQLAEASAGLIALPFVVAAGRIGASVSVQSGRSSIRSCAVGKKTPKEIGADAASSLLIIFRYRDDRYRAANLRTNTSARLNVAGFSHTLARCAN